MVEKRRVLTNKLVWAALLMIGIAMFFITAFVILQSVSVVSDKLTVTEYNEKADFTRFDYEITFDKAVDMGAVTVEIYDDENQLIRTQLRLFFNSEDNVRTLVSPTVVQGKIGYCKVVEWSDIRVSKTTKYIAWSVLIVIDLIMLAIFIASMFLNSKTYIYDDKEIVVYAGWFNYYIKVDGQLLDKCKAVCRRSAINLSCTLQDGAEINSTISFSKRIALKINGELVNEIKKQPQRQSKSAE